MCIFIIKSSSYHFFAKTFWNFPNYIYLCIDLGEKSRVTDALAFISHFTEKTSEILFGIVRFNCEESREGSPNHHAAMHAPYGVEHSYLMVGVPIPRSAPQVKCIRVAAPFFVSKPLHTQRLFNIQTYIMKGNTNKFSKEYLFREGVLHHHCILLRLHEAIPWDNGIVDEVYMVDVYLSEKEKEELFQNIASTINTYGMMKIKAFARLESPYKAREIIISTDNILEIEKRKIIIT